MTPSTGARSHRLAAGVAACFAAALMLLTGVAAEPMAVSHEDPRNDVTPQLHRAIDLLWVNATYEDHIVRATIDLQEAFEEFPEGNIVGFHLLVRNATDDSGQRPGRWDATVRCATDDLHLSPEECPVTGDMNGTVLEVSLVENRVSFVVFFSYNATFTHFDVGATALMKASQEGGSNAFGLDFSANIDPFSGTDPFANRDAQQQSEKKEPWYSNPFIVMGGAIAIIVIGSMIQSKNKKEEE